MTSFICDGETEGRMFSALLDLRLGRKGGCLVNPASINSKRSENLATSVKGN